MRSPTEQLIRDYLNRLSMAARGRLSEDDRRALVLRADKFIDRQISLSGPADPKQVAALLWDLGDPGVLVEQELARLAVERGDVADQAAPRPVKAPRRWRGQRGQPTRYHLPRGSKHLQARLIHGAGGAPIDAATRRSSGDAPPIWVPVQPRAPAVEAANEEAPAALAEITGGSGHSARPVWPSGPARRAYSQPGGSQAPNDDASDAGAGADVVVPGTRLANALVNMVRSNPIESIAIVLLGLGGAIYPPIWLLGAGVGMTSREWDVQDKWLGMAGPVVIVVIGTCLGVGLGHKYSSLGGLLHESWIYADALSRISAIVGAYYLGWRLFRGKRGPAVPPWLR